MTKAQRKKQGILGGMSVPQWDEFPLEPMSVNTNPGQGVARRTKAPKAPTNRDDRMIAKMEDEELERSYKRLLQKSKANKGVITPSDVEILVKYLSKHKKKFASLSLGSSISSFEALNPVEQMMYASTDYYGNLADRLFEENVGGSAENSPRFATDDQVQAAASGLSSSERMNPFFRKRISTEARQREDMSQRYFFHLLDKELSTRNFLDGARPLSPEVQLALLDYFSVGTANLTLQKAIDRAKSLLSPKGGNEAPKSFGEAMLNHQRQSLVVMQSLFMMQIGNTYYTDQDGLDHAWTDNMANGFTNGGRFAFILPSVDKNDDPFAMEDMLGINPFEDQNHIYRRAAATHVARRAKAHGKKSTEGYKETGGLKSFIKSLFVRGYHHYGMDYAIGGLGQQDLENHGLFLNNGTNGHFYIGMHAGDERHKGVMLMGLESEAPGLANRLGHVHDARATGASITSSGGFDTDRVGRKYQGRTADVSALGNSRYSKLMQQFRHFHEKAWKQKDAYKPDSDINQTIDFLGRRRIESSKLADFIANKLGFSNTEAQEVVAIGRQENVVPTGTAISPPVQNTTPTSSPIES